MWPEGYFRKTFVRDSRGGISGDVPRIIWAPKLVIPLYCSRSTSGAVNGGVFLSFFSCFLFISLKFFQVLMFELILCLSRLFLGMSG